MARESKTGALRKMTPTERRRHIAAAWELTEEELEFTGGNQLELADILVETAIGYTPVPLGLAEGFVIDGEVYSVPMATEEPSVVAAASYGARIIASGDGFVTRVDEPVMTAQIHLESVKEDAAQQLENRQGEIEQHFETALASMSSRGGGYRGVTWRNNDKSGTFLVHVDVDVRDAMGANILNTAAEEARDLFCDITGGKVIMAILTNSAAKRKARAEFTLPLTQLSRVVPAEIGGDEAGRRIVLANRIAKGDHDRAVTHNKGIMNGITALALATGNDTRGIEAAAHAWASREGAYQSLTEYSIENETLHAALELPLPFATVGGAIQYHPAYTTAMKALGMPDARQLSGIAASVGLAQNFAALLALVTTGIQRGHMLLHARRVAYRAGARGAEIQAAAKTMAAEGKINEEEAAVILKKMRGEYE